MSNTRRALSLAMAGVACRTIREQLERGEITPRKAIDLLQWAVAITAPPEDIPEESYPALRLISAMTHRDDATAVCTFLDQLSQRFKEWADSIPND